MMLIANGFIPYKNLTFELHMIKHDITTFYHCSTNKITSNRVNVGQ